ncbi:MAG: hypothetical protein L6R41_003553 [Letrouitia leprolyta]|nr:MAG: hypothetical protein L6R41_003553 [Letrouitia leprolyta]
MFIICPANLVDDWIKELDFIMSDVPISVVYGHKKNRKFGGNVHVLDVNLSKKHALFNGHEKNAQEIVLTSSATMARRHGSNPQKRWRVVNLKWTGRRAREQLFYFDSENFPHALDGQFGNVIVDETHVAKNLEKPLHIIPFFGHGLALQFS